MATTINTSKEYEELLESIKTAKENIKKRQSNNDKEPRPTIDKEKRKEAREDNKKASMVMKVVTFLAVVFFGTLWVVSWYVPNVYEVIAAIFRDIFPSVSDTTGIDFYVD